MACFLLVVGVVLGILLMLLEELISPISTELGKPYMLDLDAHDFALTSQITLVPEHSISVVNHLSVVLSSLGEKYHI